MENNIRVLIVDDHPIFRSGLRALLSLERGINVVGEASTGREAVGSLDKLEPDMIIMDVRMPDLNGVDAARQALEARPRMKVIGLSASGDDASAMEMLRAGAVGYVKKESAYSELVSAIQTVMNNNIYCSSGVLSQLMNERASGVRSNSRIDTLSKREREALQLISEGKSTKEIASTLDISIKTAETHRRNLMEKLNVGSVAELTKCAIRAGLTAA